MAVMIDGVSKVWLITGSSTSGLSVEGFKGEAELVYELWRRRLWNTDLDAEHRQQLIGNFTDLLQTECKKISRCEDKDTGEAT